MLSEQEARDAYAGESAPEGNLLATMRSAASIVAGLSKVVPEDADDYTEYVEAVKSAEILVGDYLWQTGGYLKSDNVLDASVSYGSLAEVKEAASAALGAYMKPRSSGRVVRIV